MTTETTEGMETMEGTHVIQPRPRRALLPTVAPRRPWPAP